MPNIYIIVISALLFAFCTASLIYQLIYSSYFRAKIALTHGFSEGIMCGPVYPFLWIVYGLIGVQFFSFIVLKSGTDLVFALRLLAFAISVILFAVLKSLTPPLLAYWLGKTAIWNGRGLSGKIPYTDLICVNVHSTATSSISNQQICKVTFYLKDRTFLLLPKRHTCKMVAQHITVFTDYIDLNECQKPRASGRALLYSIFAPILLISLMACAFLIAFAKINTLLLLPIALILLFTLFALKQFVC